MKLYKQRDFGELIGAPFLFFGKEIKTILTGLLIFIGPFILLKLILIEYFHFSPAEDIYTKIQNFGQIGNNQTSLLLQIIEFFQNVMLYTFVGAFLKIIVRNKSEQIEISDIWNEMRRFYWPFAGGMFLSSLIMIIGFILLVIPGIYLSVALVPLYAIIIFEENGISKSISRSFELIKGYWWLTFGLVIVLFIVLVTLSGILNLFFEFLFRSFLSGNLYQAFVGTTLSILEVLDTFLIISLAFFLYGHLIAEKEQPELTDRISDITQEEKHTDESEYNSEEKEFEKTENFSENNHFIDKNDTDRFKPKF